MATGGDDIINGTSNADTIDGLGGKYTIAAKTRPTIAGSGIDVVDGGTGSDTLVVNCSAETQSVSLGTGSSPTFTVRSTSGNFYVDAYNMEKVKFTGGSGIGIFAAATVLTQRVSGVGELWMAALITILTLLVLVVFGAKYSRKYISNNSISS